MSFAIPYTEISDYEEDGFMKCYLVKVYIITSNSYSRYNSSVLMRYLYYHQF
jgi:hypothetical protein